jgi:hypothetical protein
MKFVMSKPRLKLEDILREFDWGKQDLGRIVRGRKRYLDFLQRTDKLEAKITGLSCDQPKLILYKSGAGCIRDLLENSFQELKKHGIDEMLEVIQKEIERHPLKAFKSLVVERSRGIWKIPLIPLKRIAKRKNSEYLFNHILGGYDLIEIGLGSYGFLRIVPSNITMVAAEKGVEPSSLERWVLTHERIHHRQSSNFPELDRRRYELARDYLFGYLYRRFGFTSELLKREARKMEKEKPEELYALFCLLEGHATYYSKLVIKEFLHLNLFKRVEKDTRSMGERFWMKVGNIFSPTKVSFKDRYSKGEKFIAFLDREGGKDLVREALSNPPKNVREINNPPLYLGRIT